MSLEGIILKEIYDEYIQFIKSLSNEEWNEIILKAQEHTKDEEE